MALGFDALGLGLAGVVAVLPDGLVVPMLLPVEPPAPPDPIQQDPTYDSALADFEKLPPIRVLFDNGAGGSNPGEPYPGFTQTFPTFPVPGTTGRSWYLAPGGALAAKRAARASADKFTWNAHARPLTDFKGDTAGGTGGLWTATPPYKWVDPPAGSGLSYVTSPLEANTTGNKNIALGITAGQNLTTGDNNIDIGNGGVAAEANTIRIGDAAHTRTFIAGISGANIGKGVVVEVDASGQLGARASSRRFKQEIKPMDKASEAILALKPVTFRYKKELDPEGTPQFGLVAEEVEKVNPDLVARDRDGKPYTVRYEAVNAMLLNEFLKEHKAFIEEQRKVQEQEAAITQLKQDFQSRLAHQQKQIEALTMGLQKVSEQSRMSKPATQVAENN